jgi:hypothetical protein
VFCLGYEFDEVLGAVMNAQRIDASGFSRGPHRKQYIDRTPRTLAEFNQNFDRLWRIPRQQAALRPDLPYLTWC